MSLLKRLDIFILLIFTIGLCMLMFFMLTEKFYWQEISKQTSPDKSYTLYQYRYSSDGNRHAPYGTYLFLQPTKATATAVDGYVIFAGYCENKDLYKWINNQQVEITCKSNEEKSIRTLAKQAFGITINAQILSIESTQENKAGSNPAHHESQL